MRTVKYVGILGLCLYAPAAMAQVMLWPGGGYGCPCLADYTGSFGENNNTDWRQAMSYEDIRVIKCTGDIDNDIIKMKSRAECGSDYLGELRNWNDMACRFVLPGGEYLKNTYVCGDIRRGCAACLGMFDRVSDGGAGNIELLPVYDKVDDSKVKRIVTSIQYSFSPDVTVGNSGYCEIYTAIMHNPQECHIDVTTTETYICADGYYRSGGSTYDDSIVCSPCPANATCSGEGNDFKCNKNFYKDGNACTACPFGGTTAGAGSTDVSACSVSQYCFDDAIGHVCYEECIAQ